MSDPRLNSIHLDRSPRRDEYRKAREHLLGMFGSYTIVCEPGIMPEAATCPPIPAGQLPPETPVDARPSRFCIVDHGTVYALKVGLNTLGRLNDNDVAIADSGISRRHCAIVVHSTDQCELLDTASKNGTFLNGKRIQGTVRLAEGDEVKLCDRKLVFLSKESLARQSSDSKTMIE